MVNITYFRPCNIRPVIAENTLRATHRTAYASYCYMRREPDTDRYGPMPKEWATRGDLVITGRVCPAQTPAWARSGPKIWKDADASVFPHCLDQAAASHIVLTLPPHEDTSLWEHLIKKFGTEHLADHGMIADWAIHHKPDEIAPHAHLLVTARSWRTYRAPGRRHPRWLANPEAIRTAELAWIDISGLRPIASFSQLLLGTNMDKPRTPSS